MSANSSIICIFPCKCSLFVLIFLSGVLLFWHFFSSKKVVPELSFYFNCLQVYIQSKHRYFSCDQYVSARMESCLQLFAGRVIFVLHHSIATLLVCCIFSYCIELPRFCWDGRPPSHVYQQQIFSLVSLCWSALYFVLMAFFMASVSCQFVLWIAHQ